MQGDVAEAERWLAVAEKATYDGVSVDGTASFESGRAIFRSMLCPSGPERMLSDARFALDSEPADSVWRDTALVTCGEATLMLGDRESARELFEETSVVAEKVSGTDNFVIAEAQLAMLDVNGGKPGDATRHAERAHAAIEKYRIHDYGISLIAFATGASVALHNGDLDLSRRRLVEGMRSRQFCTAAIPYLAVRGRLQLGRVFLALADLSSARHLLREIDDILHVRPKLGVLIDDVEEFRVAISSSTASTPGRAPLTPAELRLLPYLQTHLTLPEIADRLFVSVNTVRTQVGSIYRKLGVARRAEAVERAVDVGLLGG
jgi:LuxR family maltose regulon positive regulatory protein